MIIIVSTRYYNLLEIIMYYFKKSLAVIALGLVFSSAVSAHDKHFGHIQSPANENVVTSFDIIHAKVTTRNGFLEFQQVVSGKVGSKQPTPVGSLGGAEVYSYVWPTSLNSAAVGFEADQGILALVLTVHPDFDDTPLYDENNDGVLTNDGDLWHSHWVVLAKDDACEKGSLKVKDIPANTQPKLPKTWPKLPIFIDSPGYDFSLEQNQVTIKVPLSAIADNADFQFDAVTAALKVNQQIHAPLLCVTDVFDIASGDLSLPGKKL